jgi:hypothetical protein
MILKFTDFRRVIPIGFIEKKEHISVFYLFKKLL